MLEEIYSLEIELLRSQEKATALAEAIRQAKYHHRTASQAETEYSSGFRALIHKLTGKYQETLEQFSREASQAEGELNRLLWQQTQETDRQNTLREQLSKLPSRKELCTPETKSQWAPLEYRLCAQQLLPLLEETAGALETYRQMLRGEFPVLGVDERQEMTTAPIRTAEACASLVEQAVSLREYLGHPQEDLPFFRNPAGFLAAAARHNSLNRAAEAADQVQHLRNILSK